MDYLYFIAILPDHIILNEIMDFKLIAKDRFGSSKSLNSPPHITVIPPFKSDVKKQKEIMKCLNQVRNNTKEFYISLTGFNKFDKKVIYVDVEKNALLDDLREKLIKEIVKIVPDVEKTSNEFKPHITVAFRDLKKEVFPEAWEYFSKIEYFRIFKAGKLTLLRHNGRKWQIV